jgi:uncharacterized membrane protein
MDETGSGTEAFRGTLKRVGWRLVIVGALDIGVMIWAIVNKVSYSSSFNVFALVGGLFMLRGNLTAAEIWRFMATMMTGAFATMLLVAATGLWTTLGLLWAQFKQQPISSLTGAAIGIAVLSFAAWVARELNRSEVRQARVVTGRKVRSITLPSVFGVAITLVLVRGMHGDGHAARAFEGRAALRS